MKTLLFLFMSGLTVSMFSCIEKYPIEKDKPFVGLDEEFKSYFTNFGIGTMYIFQDSVTGEIDTTIITDRYYFGNFAVSDHNEEGYILRYTCTNTPDFKTETKTSVVKGDTSYSFKVTYQASGSHSIRKSQGIIEPVGGDVKIIDSLIIMDQTYYNVLEVTGWGGPHYQRFIFAPDIGIILKETAKGAFSAKTFLLKKHEIK